MLQMVKQLLVHSNHNQDISESLVGYDNSPSLEEKEFKEQADKFVRNIEQNPHGFVLLLRVV